MDRRGIVYVDSFINAIRPIVLLLREEQGLSSRATQALDLVDDYLDELTKARDWLEMVVRQNAGVMPQHLTATCDTFFLGSARALLAALAEAPAAAPSLQPDLLNNLHTITHTDTVKVNDGGS